MIFPSCRAVACDAMACDGHGRNYVESDNYG